MPETLDKLRNFEGELIAERDRLRTAAVRAIDILNRNLYHQREKCEDAISILRQALYPDG